MIGIDLRSISIVILGLAPLVHGQVYLVTGNPDPKGGQDPVSSLILQVGSDGNIEPVAAVTDSQSSLFWMDASYEQRKLVAVTQATRMGGQTGMVVIHFDKADEVKRCLTGVIGGENSLAYIPGKGLALVWLDLEESQIAVLADPSVPCEDSVETVPHAYITSIIVDHPAALEDEVVAIGMDENGQVWKRWHNGEVYLNYRVPESLRAGIERPVFSLIVNNPRMLVVALSNGTSANSRLLAFRKSDETWHRVPSAEGAYVGSLGRYVVLQRTHSRGRVSLRVYTGQFDLFNLDSEKLLSFDSKADDCEALLVEDGTIYYRVGSRLFSAPVTDAGIGASTLLATDEQIKEAHWAFIRH